MLHIQLGDIGLLADLLGATLLFFFGLAPLLSKDGAVALSTGTSAHLKRKAAKYEMLSRIGLALIIAGFALQLAGNHYTRPVTVELVIVELIIVIAVVGASIGGAVHLIYKSKYRLIAAYIPQYNEQMPSYSPRHMWELTFTNSSRSLVKSPMLHLSGTPDTITALPEGEHTQVLEPAQTITLGDVLPGKSIAIQVWNIGGYEEAALDCTLTIGKRTIRPKLSAKQRSYWL